MYAKSKRPSAKREVQKDRSAKRDDQIARPRRAQACERSELRAMRTCPRSEQIFFLTSEKPNNLISLKLRILIFMFLSFISGNTENFEKDFEQNF